MKRRTSPRKANSRRTRTPAKSRSEPDETGGGGRRGPAIIAVVAALVGILAGAASLIDWTGAKLDPPPPTEIDARVMRVQLSTTSQPLEDYLRETRQTLEGLTAPERREPGLRFNVRVRFQGATKKRFPLMWSLYDADRRRRLRGKTYNQEGAVFTPRGPNHARTWPLWVPYPPRPGRYLLRVTLVDPERRPVDELDSDPFPVRHVPAVG